MKFHIGDIVECFGETDDIEFNGQRGVIRVVGPERVGIAFDDDIGGHNLNGTVPYGHGWYCDLDVVRLIKRAEPDIGAFAISFDEIFEAKQ